MLQRPSDPNHTRKSFADYPDNELPPGVRRHTPTYILENPDKFTQFQITRAEDDMLKRDWMTYRDACIDLSSHMWEFETNINHCAIDFRKGRYI